MGFEVGRIDHQSSIFSRCFCQFGKNIVEDAHPAPAQKAVVQRFIRAILTRWSWNDVLSLYDRSVVTVSALIASGVTGPLKYHIATAKEHGVTKKKMVEIITQLAFYAGWPKAWAAFPVAREVYGK